MKEVGSKKPVMFNTLPAVEVEGFHVTTGWDNICTEINTAVSALSGNKKIVVIETYQGVVTEELAYALEKGLLCSRFFHSVDYMKNETDIKNMVYPDVTDDRIFGFLTRLKMEDYFDTAKVDLFQHEIAASDNGVIVVYGSGAAILANTPDLLVYADMARWEIQQRMRRHLVDNLGVKNRNTGDWMLLYKQGFFVDWRVCDKLKKKLMDRWDYVLDTNSRTEPKLVSGEAVRAGLRACLQRPFSLVPFFDPGPWGGQWMKEFCNLDPAQQNYAWCFNCVPEENSLLLDFEGTILEIPSVNLVFYAPEALLGPAVHGRFGDEFPIRFDYLDTIDGGHLSLQVHPLTEYIRQEFGMPYTQDESYYMMEAKPGAVVYLGLKEGVNPGEMIADLEEAQAGLKPFDAEKHVQTWPVKKHDHFLIPGGTIHCSGKNGMVLEISATPYIFTFKLWDWGRVGLDGKPRPINIEHGKHNIQWDRTTDWTKNNLVNKIEKIGEGADWVEERTGLHEREFIETRRHWFTGPVSHNTNGGVNVICLVEGDEIVVESPVGAFRPFYVHYAETFIVPACVGGYTIRPAGGSDPGPYATMKAFVRKNA